MLLCFILVACGDLKLGDTFILKRTAVGGLNINSMEKAVDQMKALEEIGEPDALEEYLDLDEIASISVGEVVRVIGINDKPRMLQIQNVNPKTGSIVKMWMTRKELNESKQ